MGRRKAQTIEPPPPVVEPEVSEPEPPSPEPSPALPPPPFSAFVPRQRVIPPAVRAAAKRKLQRIQRQDKMATYQENLIGYVKEQLQLTMTPDQERMLHAIAKNRRVAIKGSHAIGKCVAASEFIPLANGSRLRASELVGKEFWLNTLIDGEVCPVHARASWNTVEPVYAVETESGRRIVRNAEHPLWAASVTRGCGVPTVVSPQGWVPLARLEPGQLVAVASYFPCPETLSVPFPDHEIIALAYLIGDGGFAAGEGIKFTQQENAVLGEMREVASVMGSELVPTRSRPYDYRLVGKVRRKNKVVTLLRSHGLMGKHSRDKRVPSCIFALDERRLRLFLSRLFATDGWACINKNGSAEIGFCSASRGLCLDVQELLIRFGICVHVTPKPKVNAWILWIHNSKELVKFCERVGIYGKEANVELVRQNAVAKAAGRQKAKWRTETALPGTRWETIARIEPVGVEATVAIEVPDHNTFLSTFYEHNTIVAAIVVSWWFDCWDQHIAYISAPTWQQALGLTFKQLKTLRRQLDLPGTIQETGKILDEDKLKAGGHFIQAINAETQEGFLGEHSAPILIVLEESPGVPAHIWAATDGLMTSPGCRLVALGNPTDESTPFGKVCTKKRGLWEVIEVSALNHPNIAAELKAQPAPYPNAVRLIWLKEMLEKECTVVDDLVGDAFRFWSVPSLEAAMGGLSVTANPHAEQWCYLPNAVFQGRALGQFPTQAFEQVIPRNWLANLARIESPHWTPEVGCDPARHGDDRTTILVRRGPCVMSAREIRRYNLDAVTGAIIDMVREAAEEAHCSALAIPIRIDVTGGLGAGPCDRLAGMGYMAEGVNSSSSAFDSESFVNRRSELWFSSRDRIYARDLDLSRLPGVLCETLIDELSTPKWKPNGRGQKVVDPKEATKRTLGASPDLADAFNLAFSPSALQPAETEVEEDPYDGRRI